MKREMETCSSNSFSHRSISLPTKTNPILHRVEECLAVAKGWQAQPHSLTSNGLAHLKDLFFCTGNFLQMAYSQQALRRKEKFVNQLMDDFLRLLDVCGMVKDSVQQMREQQEALQSMFRRRDQNLHVGISRYQSTRKRMRKEMIKCQQMMKTMEVLAFPSDDCKVEAILRDVKTNTVYVFELLASIISARNPSWSVFSRLLSSKRQNSPDEENINEIERLDAALFAACGQLNKELAEDSVQSAQRLMENLDRCLRGVEDELEGVFRCLINARVTLLNILTCS
ncbi:uncharacterized protein LOC116261068 [Nymphaea colorata]|nr:uncharacterized protein LOC116261068 [Nymphaea colorata]